jgi:hypothetical protein
MSSGFSLHGMKLALFHRKHYSGETIMRHGFERTLLLVGCLLLVIGSMMLVSTSSAATPDCDGAVTCHRIDF